MLFGLIVGIAIGLLVGPALRSWLVWREHVEADREARLHEEILRRLEAPAGWPSRPERPLHS
jgi:hypothetical protein